MSCVAREHKELRHLHPLKFLIEKTFKKEEEEERKKVLTERDSTIVINWASL